MQSVTKPKTTPLCEVVCKYSDGEQMELTAPHPGLTIGSIVASLFSLAETLLQH